MCWVLRWSLQMWEDASMSPTVRARWTLSCACVYFLFNLSLLGPFVSTFYLTAFAAMFWRSPRGVAFDGLLWVRWTQSWPGCQMLRPAQMYTHLLNSDITEISKLTCQILAHTQDLIWAWHFYAKGDADVSTLKKVASVPLLVKVKVCNVLCLSARWRK